MVLKDQKPKILIAIQDEFAVFKVLGRAQHQLAYWLKEATSRLIEQAYTQFYIDLQECPIVDSTFIGVLVGLWKQLGKARSKGKQTAIVLIGPQPHVQQSMDEIGVLNFFQVIPALPMKSPDQGAWTEVSSSSQPSDSALRETILEAHRLLASLSQENESRFRDVIEFLQNNSPSNQPQSEAEEGETT